MGQGSPSVNADQSHKPVKAYTKERMAEVLKRYEMMEDYATK